MAEQNEQPKTGRNEMTKLSVILPAAAISLLMFIALGDNPSGYYAFLRIATTVVAAYLAYKTYENDNNNGLVWVFVAIAVLFNPFIPIYLNREAWAPIDIITAITILVCGIILNYKIHKAR